MKVLLFSLSLSLSLLGGVSLSLIKAARILIKVQEGSILSSEVTVVYIIVIYFLVQTFPPNPPESPLGWPPLLSPSSMSPFIAKEGKHRFRFPPAPHNGMLWLWLTDQTRCGDVFGGVWLQVLSKKG